MTKKTDAAEAATEAPMLALIDPATMPAEVIAAQTRLILLDAKKFDEFYDKVKGQTDAFVPDLSTAKGRADVASMAFRVTKTKTALDKAALALTEDWRKQTATVNASRKIMTTRLDELAETVRAPLTEWEAAEKARAAANAAEIQRIRDAATVADNDTEETVTARGREIYLLKFEAPGWTDDEAAEAIAAQNATVQALVAARNRLRQEEADRAELAALRAEREAREAREAEAQAQRDREAAEAAEVERQAQAERDRVAAQEAAEQAERDRIAAAEREAADQARREAEAEAQAERDRLARENEAALAAERERAAAAERQAARLKREREEAVSAAAAEAAETARRASNRDHAAKIMGEAKADIMTCGVDEDTARKIVLAIVGNVVRHTTVTF